MPAVQRHQHQSRRLTASLNRVTSSDSGRLLIAATALFDDVVRARAAAPESGAPQPSRPRRHAVRQPTRAASRTRGPTGRARRGGRERRAAAARLPSKAVGHGYQPGRVC